MQWGEPHLRTGSWAKKALLHMSEWRDGAVIGVAQDDVETALYQRVRNPLVVLTDRTSPTARRELSRSGLLNRIPREDILDSRERLLCGLLRGHALLDDVGPGGLPDMLVLDLRISRVIS